MGALAFVFAEAIPVFNYMLSLAGSICFAPMSLIFPAWMWFHDLGALARGDGLKGKAMIVIHAMIVAVGVFLTVGGM